MCTPLICSNNVFSCFSYHTHICACGLQLLTLYGVFPVLYERCYVFIAVLNQHNFCLFLVLYSGHNTFLLWLLIEPHTHTRLMALFPGLPGWAGTRKVKPVWILLEQETVSGSGICWAICKSAPRSRQITMPAPHHSVFLEAGCPSCHPTNSVKVLKAVKLCVAYMSTSTFFSLFWLNFGTFLWHVLSLWARHS